MPTKNSIKIYVENGYYHIYNRGVEKRTIFQDEQDYKVFLNYLKFYLSPPPNKKDLLKNFSLRGVSFKGVAAPLKNYEKSISLLAYCLMPNHFHLLIKQVKQESMEFFMRSLATRYSVYFNKKYDRVGKLFQGTYKACIVENDNYLLHLSRYIHQNPGEYTNNLAEAYSSCAEYLGIRKTAWVKPNLILSYFNQSSHDFLKGFNTYRHFIEAEKYTKLGITSFPENLTLE